MMDNIQNNTVLDNKMLFKCFIRTSDKAFIKLLQVRLSINIDFVKMMTNYLACYSLPFVLTLMHMIIFYLFKKRRHLQVHYH